jgi:hypothetical protein
MVDVVAINGRLKTPPPFLVEEKNHPPGEKKIVQM